MEYFVANEYGDRLEYETIRLSGEFLSNKIQRLLDNGMMHTLEDVVGLTGTIFYFTVPFCAN